MGNPIDSFNELAPLKQLKNLVQLNFYGTPIFEDLTYRQKVFSMFSNLDVNYLPSNLNIYRLLDNRDKKGNILKYGEEE